MTVEAPPRSVDYQDRRQPTYRYDLPIEQVRALTQEYLATQTIETDDRLVCVRFSGTDPFSDIARQPEGEVFDEEFANKATDMAAEYGPYEASSIFYCVIDREAMEPAGTIRMIADSPAGFKTLNDLEDPNKVQVVIPTKAILEFHNIKPNECWDGGTAAVRRKYRYIERGKVHAQLERGWYLDAARRGIKHVVSHMEKKILRTLRDFIGLPLVPICGGPDEYSRYLGAQESQAVYGYIPDFKEAAESRWRNVQKATNKLAKIVLGRVVGGSDDDTLLFLRDDYKSEQA